MRVVLGLLILFCLPARPAAAQWRIGLELADTRYRGSAHDTSSTTTHPDARPGSTTMVGLRISRGWGRWGRWGAAVRASYGKTRFSLGTKQLEVTTGGTGRLVEFAGLVNTRVGGIGSSGAARVELGPALHLWDFDQEIRARLGALGAFSYEWPVAGRVSGSVRLEGTLSKSWFNAADVPPEFERRVTWRYGVGLGVSYRL